MDTFFVLLCTVLAVVLAFLQFTFRYWEFRGIPQPTVNKIIGTIQQIKTLHLADFFEFTYRECKGKFKFIGTYIFFKPIIVVMDLELLKHIMIKDFNYFVNRTDDFHNGDTEPLARHVSRLNGNEWKTMRSKLTPTFTSGKMKSMFPIVSEIADNFAKIFEKELNESSSKSLEVVDLCARYTTDVIGSVIFGIECQSLYDKNNAFREFGKKAFALKNQNIKWRLFTTTHLDLMKFFGAKKFNPGVTKFIVNMVRETVEFREKNNIKRNDLMGNLIELKNFKDEAGNFQLSLNDLAAQAYIFFIAGFETSSGNMSFSLYELAKHPDIQEKLRSEILEVLKKHDDKLTYEAVQDMKYLKQVTEEALRMHPPLSAVTRISVKDYKVPGSNTVIPSGSKIYIPVREIHMDPDIYDNPTEFRPERFSPEEIAKRHPLSFLAFGTGPRNCIGMRFGEMQSSIGLITLLKNFRFSFADETPKVISYSDANIVCVADKGIKLRVEKL